MSSSNDSSSSGQETSPNSNLTLEALGIATSVALFLFVLIYYMKESINDWRQRQLAPVSTITTAPVIPDQPSNGGLDLDDISLLPKFIYRPSKTSFRRKDKHNQNQKGKGKALLAECAVCISELEEGDIVRVLPTCKHFFHVKCIDTWLFAHSSCPMCRAHPEPEKVKLGVISASPPLPQLTRCGTMSERKQSINFGSLFGSPFMKNSSRGVSPYWHGSSLQGSPYMFTPPRRLSQETRIEVRFLDDSEIHEITERIS